MALLLLVSSVGACSSGNAALPAAPAVVEVTMHDDRFEFANPGPVPAGRVVFEVRNAGSVDHDLHLVRLPEAMVGSLLEELRSDRPAVARPVTRLKPRSPGQRGVFAVDLEAGNYGIVCFVKDDDGVLHAIKGMAAEFQVR